MELPTNSNSTNADPSDLLCLMTALPLINHQWKAVYAYFSGRNLWIPSIPYLFYIGMILRTNHSSVLTINCGRTHLNEHFVDAEKHRTSKRARMQRMEVYRSWPLSELQGHWRTGFPHAVLSCHPVSPSRNHLRALRAATRQSQSRATRITFPLNGTHSEWTIKLQDTKLINRKRPGGRAGPVAVAEDYVPLDKQTVGAGPVIISPKRGKIMRGRWRAAHRSRNVYHYQALSVKCGMPRLSRSWWRIWKKWLAESVRDEGAFDVVSQLDRQYDRQERWFALIQLSAVGNPVRDH
ncbi:hypothetical protein CPB85DRAFT_1319890 [Mucidula mucida]|nr:hypothetical protein CPB85DRAFT_1319890 [Mucidula mucida]